MGKPVSKLTISHVKQEKRGVVYQAANTIPDCLKYFATELPDKEAVVFASTDGNRVAITFKELYEKAVQVARVLVHLGIKPNEFVAIALRTCPEWLYIAFGTMIAGATPFGLNFTYKDGCDVVAMMERIQTCTCMVLDPGFEDGNWDIMSNFIDEYSPDGNVVCKKLPSLRYLFAHNSGTSLHGIKQLNDLISENGFEGPEIGFPEVHEDDIAMLFQTSGSTGYPKVVAHSHRSLTSATNVNRPDIYGSNDIYFSDRPFEWIGGFPFGLFIGQTRVTCSGTCDPPENRAEYLASVIRDEKCNLIVGLPTLLQEMAKRNVDFGAGWQAKGILTGGQPITKTLFTGFESLTKNFFVGYGGSEFFCASLNTVSDMSHYDNYDCGPVYPGMEVKVVDEDGQTVPVNTRGEIYVRSDCIFQGYYNDPEKTDAVKTPDGWYKTDDIGRMTENGTLYVEGRKSYMILSGGFNVAPEILEALITSCPEVEAAVVVPVPDDVKYQLVCACVKVANKNEIDEKSIQKFCEESHSDKQGLFTVLPTYYLILESFPETNTGKVSRKDLTELAVKTFKK